MLIFSYLLVLTYVLGARKNRLIETVLLSTYNICFAREIRKLFFSYLHLEGYLERLWQDWVDVQVWRTSLCCLSVMEVYVPISHALIFKSQL